MFNKRSISMLFAIFAMAPTMAYAQSCTLTAGGASYVIPATSHYDTTPTSNFTGVGTGDQLFEDGWWFRVAGDTQEFFFPVPDTTTCAGAAGTITWNNVSTRGFRVTNTLALTSPGAGKGEVILTMAITNLSATTPLVISLFHGADFDVNGTALGDNAILLAANTYIRIADTTTGVAEQRAFGPPANALLVRAFGPADVFGLLSDALVNNFDNTGLPAGPIDYTGGFQWNLDIPAGGTRSVSVALNSNAPPTTPVTLKNFSVD